MKIFNLIITTKKTQDYLLRKNHLQGMEDALDIYCQTSCAAIIPVIHSLKELRNNTWDKDRCDKAIKWLIDNFEVKE